MFEDKKILVVGGSSGIGAEVSRLLMEQSAEVVVWSRQEPKNLTGSQWHSVDVTKPLEEQLEQEFETLDGIAYCPGTITLGSFPRLSLDQFREDHEVNLLGAV